MTVQQAADYLVGVAPQLFAGISVEPRAHVERLVREQRIPFRHVPRGWDRPGLDFVQADLTAWLAGAPLEVVSLGRGLVHIRPRV